MTFAQAAAGIYHWLRENNMETKGFRLVLSFPDAMAKAQADMTLSRELQGLMLNPSAPGGIDTKQFEMHGIDTRFESRKDK
jgi:hypothetical protein